MLPFSLRPFGLLLVCAAAVSVLCSGCGNSKAARAQMPPPQSLSEPVRPSSESESVPAQAPPLPPPSSPDAYSAQKPGESRDLQVFRDPNPPAPAPAAAQPAPGWNAPASASAPAARSSGGTYHTLEKGETLYAVARKYNVKPRQLIDANNFKDPNHLAVGTKVYVPVN